MSTRLSLAALAGVLVLTPPASAFHLHCGGYHYKVWGSAPAAPGAVSHGVAPYSVAPYAVHPYSVAPYAVHPYSVAPYAVHPYSVAPPASSYSLPNATAEGTNLLNMLGLLRNACQHVQPPAGSGTPTDLAQLNRTLATIQSDLAALKRNQAALLRRHHPSRPAAHRRPRRHAQPRRPAAPARHGGAGG